MTSHAPLTLQDLEAMREGVDLEVKAAQGRDKRGALPKDLWPSYAAMANTRGGRIVLGVAQNDDGSLVVRGLAEPERLLQDFWSTVSNPATVSACVLDEDDVRVEELDGRRVLVIDVPRAHRSARPLYVGGDPFRVYLRRYESDVLVKDRERVRRMIAEGQYDTRDDGLVEGFGLQDIEKSSLAVYRQRFRDRSPDHPWLELDDWGLLHRLGAARRDRQTGAEALTLAGLLMFGTDDALRYVRPGHMLDYQERSRLDDQDWTHRIYADGAWSGNLFDFYRKVMPRLVDGLNVPFTLGPDLFRREETHVHEAIREAFVNCLIHADHEAPTTIVVVRAPEGLMFENPGLPRVTREQMLEGGTSDCRNKVLQKLFLRVGLGEQAGSGYSRILRAWGEQQWAAPELVERLDAERTRLRLPLVSLFPEEVLQALSQSVDRFAERDEVDRLILAVAVANGEVTNAGMQARCSEHPRDLTFRFKALVKEGVLAPHGERQGRSYTLAAAETSAPSVGALSDDPTDEVVRQVAASAWIPTARAQEAVLRLCHDQWMSLDALAQALNRKPDTVLKSYVSPLLQSGRLVRRHPSPTHPDQAYRAVQAEPT